MTPATFSSSGMVLSTPAVRKATVCCMGEMEASSSEKNPVPYLTLTSVKVRDHLFYLRL